MIENERQYGITLKALAKFREAVAAYDIAKATERIGFSVLAKAELEALKSEVEVLSDQIREYEHALQWETTEDGGDHLLHDDDSRIKARHAVRDCRGDCPLLVLGDANV